MNDNILDEQQLENSNLRRRDLLPTWIKVFVWIFLIFGAIVPIVMILGIIGMNFNLSLYGLETMRPISLTGIFITILFALKGIVAFGLWTEKKWAVNLATIDAIIGIIVCVFVMAILPFISNSNEMNVSLRLELIPLIPYLIKMRKIKIEWLERIELIKKN
jgi:hypothetical protein